MLFPQKIDVVASVRHANPHNETVVVQNDTAVEFYVAVVGDNGQTELPEGATYTLVCLHLRKQPTEKLGTLQEDGNVMFKLTHMELSETGPVQGQVRVYHPVGGRLTSNPFIFHVAPDPTYGAEIKPEDQSIIEQVIGEGPAIIAEAKEETEKNITERDRLTGAVGGALDSLAQDKADALLEMSQSKTAADESAQTALQAADNADQERDRLTQEVSDKITEVETARTDAEEATGEARSAAQLAIDEADAARLQKVEVADILGAGPVASVNGKTGVVEGLATQESVNQVTAQLADKVGGGKRASLNDLDAEILAAIDAGEGTTFNLLSEPAEKSVTFGKLSYEVSSFLETESTRSRLLGSSIEGTRQQVTFNTEGDLEKVDFVDGEGVIQRTDTFAYSGASIIESRSLASGASVTFEHDLNTLETSEYIQERIQLITQPMSVTSTTDGWVYNKSTVNGETALLSGSSAAVTYYSPDFKENTKYGFLYEVSENTIINYLRLRNDFTGSYQNMVFPGESGVKKYIFTSSATKPAGAVFQFNSSETGSLEIGNIRIFELIELSQIKYDFENLTATELNTKYPKELN